MFYFPIFAFAHSAFTVRSPCVHRAFIVRSPFTVLRSPFSVRSRSPFTKRSAIFIRNSGVKGPFLSSVFKTVTKWGLNVCARVEENFLCISEILFLLTKRQDYQLKIQRKLQSTHQFITSRQGIRNFINRHKKTGSVVDQRNGGFFLSDTFHFFWFTLILWDTFPRLYKYSVWCSGYMCSQIV